MSLTVIEKVFLTAAMIDLAGLLVWIGVCLHLANTKMDLILNCLRNCAAINIRAPLRHAGPWGKLILVGGISGIVTFPDFHLKRGQLSQTDLENLPAPLKHKLAVIQWTVIWLLFLMVLIGIPIQFGML